MAADPRPPQAAFLPHPRFVVGGGGGPLLQPPGLPPSQPQHIGHGGLEGFTPYLRTESPRFGSGALTGPGGFHAPGPYAQHPNGSGPVSPAYVGHGDAANGRAGYAVPRPRLTLPEGGLQHSAGAGVPHPRALQARSADSAPPGSFQHQQQGNWKARTGLAAPSTLSSSSTPRGGGSGGSPYDSPHAAAAASMYAGMGGPPRAAPIASPRGFAPPPLGAGPAGGGPSSPGGRRNTLGQRPQDPAEPMASAVLAAAAAAAAAARQQNGFADQGPGGQQRSVGTPRGGPPRPTHSPSPEVKPSVSQVSACLEAKQCV